MEDPLSRQLRARSGLGIAVSVTAALLATMLPVSMITATAKPPAKPGLVSGLALTAAKSGSAYQVHATWNAATNATGYRVTMSDLAGSTLDQATVTSTSYTGDTTLPVSSQVNVEVVPFNGTRRGRATTRSIVLPDLTAPSASYTVTPQNSSDGNVTIELTSLSDDLSSAAAIDQEINWDDGTSATTGDGTQTSFAHGYGSTKAIYHPVVTVTDAAGNSAMHELTVVVDDTTAPTGQFSVSPVAPTTAWANWTKVTLTVTSVDDDLSSAGDVGKLVDWGDGSTETLGDASTLWHRYTTPGSYSPEVTLTDEAGNAGSATSSSGAAVQVAVDSVAPGLRLVKPKVRKASVRSWTTLKGRSRDAGTGVRKVRVKAIEKRGGIWYAYAPGRQTWVRGGAKASAAWSKAKLARVSTTPTHTWAVKLHRLRQGTLIYAVSSVDNVNNATTWKRHKQVLTRR